MVEAVNLMQEKGLLQEDNGALVCDLTVRPLPPCHDTANIALS
jgi:hypothetical protein